MLLLISGASFSLLTQLNAASKLQTRQEVTSLALAEAKQALISYAVTFPERSGTLDPTAGPGYMSCPDTNNNGSPNPCGPSVVGRFPGEFWGVNSYLDSSGQRLWYAVSANFRNIAAKFQPMNSDTPGQLNVDGITDIVAVIIAPGEPVAGQINRPSNNVVDYLEGDNATTGDNSFTLNSGGNDVLVYITRQELMAVIEKRVLGDVEQALSSYQSSYSAYPWLSTFVNPVSSAFRGQSGTIQGHIPFHYSADASGVGGRNPFQTSVGWLWHTDVGTATGTFGGTVTADCLRNVDCSDGTFPQLSQITTPAINCTWTDKDTVNCAPVGYVLMSTIVCDEGCGDFACTREYQITIPQYTGTSSINNPTAALTRTRDIILNGNLPIQPAAVRIRDTYIGDNPFAGCVGTATYSIGTGVINFVASTTGILESRNIQYDLDIDNNELPIWFFSNSWQNLIYVAYASGEALPGDTTVGQDCITLATTCIQVSINGLPGINNVRAAVFIAGVDFPTGNTRPSGTLSDYFDNTENTDLDDVFLKNTLTATYNDQTRIISTAP